MKLLVQGVSWWERRRMRDEEREETPPRAFSTGLLDHQIISDLGQRTGKQVDPLADSNSILGIPYGPLSSTWSDIGVTLKYKAKKIIPTLD